MAPEPKGNSNPVHYVPTYLKMPTHPITVNLIGVGGNGSRILIKLAEIHQALIQMGHKGLQVKAYDPDKVELHNTGRQGFFPCDVGFNKAQVLISRVNRSFGLQWDFVPTIYGRYQGANIHISCVDNVISRQGIKKMMENKYGTRRQQIKNGYARRTMGGAMHEAYYWLDVGNGKHNGQIILGTPLPIMQPKGIKNTVSLLEDVIDRFPDMEQNEDKKAPSCSMAESLQRQDLCINDIMASYTKKLLWNLFRESLLYFSGLYTNINTLQTNPIHVDHYELPENVPSSPRPKRSPRPKAKSKQKHKSVQRRRR